MALTKATQNVIAPITSTGSTTARTLENRFADMPSIFDFGAVGNGIADDLPAFTAANNSGKLIFIPKPPVAYNVSAPIKMDKCAVLIDPNNTNWAALTDNGNINFLRGKSNGITSPAVQDCNYWRFADKILVGEMANKWTGSSTNTGNAWFADTVNYPGYLGINAKISVSTSDYSNQSINGDNPHGICAGVRTKDTLASGIALGACIVNDRNQPGTNSTAWGLMIEVQHQNQYYGSNGTEIAVRNSANSGVYLDPYTISSPSATLGIQLSGGGDPLFGPTTTGPSSIGICVTAFGGLNKWYTGIQFRKGALWGDGAGEVLPDGDSGSEAIQLSYNHAIRWWQNSSGTPTVAGSIICTNNTPNTKTKIQIDSSIVSFTNNQGFSFFTAVTNPTSASRLQINSISATQIILSSTGIAGTDVDLALSPQNSIGNGRVKFGTHVANADAPISGYIEIKDGNGTLRKLAVIS